jgi:hypothetical protein
MTWFMEIVHQGGPTVYWILYLAGPALILAILHAAMAQKWSLVASASAIVLVLAIGLYGRHQGRSLTEEAAERPDSVGYRGEMLEAGYHEANRPLQVAGVVAGVLGVLVVIGELRRRRRA